MKDFTYVMGLWGLIWYSAMSIGFLLATLIKPSTPYDNDRKGWWHL